METARLISDRADYATLNAVLEQAATQGQSVIAAAGDDGSTDCYEDTDLTTSQMSGARRRFPGQQPVCHRHGGN